MDDNKKAVKIKCSRKSIWSPGRIILFNLPIRCLKNIYILITLTITIDLGQGSNGREYKRPKAVNEAATNLINRGVIYF